MLVLLNLCAALHLPTTGRMYANTFRIPVLGTQSIQMQVLNESHARITISGIIHSSGIVEFHGDDGVLSFVVKEPLASLMKRYRCSVTHPVFDPVEDEARVTLNIHPLFFSKCLRLTSHKL
jgi:hypothetical protein